MIPFFSKRNNAKHKSIFGFSIVELLVYIVLVSVVASAGFISLFQYRNEQDVKLSTKEVSALVRDTRNRSVTQEEGSHWGIRFSHIGDENTVTVWRGVSFSSGTIVSTHGLRRGVNFGSPPLGGTIDILFDTISGNPSRSAVLTIVSNNTKAMGYITINARGKIYSDVNTQLPLAYWAFEEGEGNVAYDISNGGFVGHFSNTPTWNSTSECKVGQCVNMQSVFVSGNMVKTLSEFSVLGWVQLDAIQNKGAIFSAYNGDDGVFYARFLAASRRPSFDTTIPGEGTDALNSPTDLSFGSWYHLAYVYDGSVKRIYINGVENASSTLSGKSFSFDNFEIGRSEKSNSFLLDNSDIDDIYVFDRALSSSEVRSNFLKF